MSLDREIRELEKLVLKGDAAALEKLKALWLRRHDAQPALDALVGAPPAKNSDGYSVVVDVSARYIAVPDLSAEPKWQGLDFNVTSRVLPPPWVANGDPRRILPPAEEGRVASPVVPRSDEESEEHFSPLDFDYPE